MATMIKKASKRKIGIVEMRIMEKTDVNFKDNFGFIAKTYAFAKNRKGGCSQFFSKGSGKIIE